MGKGGGGSQQPTRTTSVSTSLPEYAEPFYKRLMARTETESSRPYEPFGGQRFAQFSPEQQESFDIASDIGRLGVPSALRLGTLRATDASTYEQPYASGQVRRAQKLADASGQAAAKLGITRAELADRAAQAEGRFGLAGEELGLKSAAQLAQLGGLEQQYGLRAADVLRQIGEQRQAQEQQLLDIGYSDFLSERDFPRQQLGYLSGIMHGVPVSPQSETSVYQRPPSAGQQLLGYGLGGLGLARSVFGQA